MPKVYMVSDRAIQIDWNTDSANGESPLLPDQLAAFRQVIVNKLHALAWPGFHCIQADQSLTVLFANTAHVSTQASTHANRILDLTVQLEKMVLSTTPFLFKPKKQAPNCSRIHKVPVNYGGPAGQDLQWLAERTGLSIEGVIDLHSSASYTVEFLGFLPGFAYLSGLPQSLQFPRRSSPRPRVPAGTLAIGAHYCAVYPWESPGGWHLLGHVEQALFNPENSDAQGQSLFNAGDTVQFVRAQHA